MVRTRHKRGALRTTRTTTNYEPTNLRGTTIISTRCQPELDFRKENDMDWNRVEGNWKQVKGKVKEKWGKLTDDDLDVIEGNRDQLEGKIQERYGWARDQVRKDIDDWYGTQRW
jgi:uncharacterized protein YjbJ (UPF0337 family)